MFLAEIVHTEILIAGITFMPYNSILKQYLTWLDNVNVMCHISIPNRNAPMGNMKGTRIP